MMIRPISLSIFVVGAVALTLAGNALTQTARPAAPPRDLTHDIMANMVRHHEVMMFGIPARYRRMRDTGPVDPKILDQGAFIFRQNCAACHGLSGHGDGPLADYLAAPPANLVWLAHVPMDRSYPYMYWAVAEGGQQFESDMPAFKDSLSKKDMRAVVAYVQYGPSPPPGSARDPIP